MRDLQENEVTTLMSPFHFELSVKRVNFTHPELEEACRRVLVEGEKQVEVFRSLKKLSKQKSGQQLLTNAVARVREEWKKIVEENGWAVREFAFKPKTIHALSEMEEDQEIKE